MADLRFAGLPSPALQAAGYLGGILLGRLLRSAADDWARFPSARREIWDGRSLRR